MRLSEVKNEDALDMLADLIEPASEILADKKVQELIKTKNRGAIIKGLIKDHKKTIIEILAIIDGVPVEEYEVNVFTLPIKLLDLLNDKELVSFFTSQVTMEDVKSSIVPMVNTEEKEK